MKMVNLIEKMHTDAFLASRRKIEEDRLFAIHLKATPEAKLADKRNELRRLQAHTNAMKNELTVKRQLEAEYKRSAELFLELKKTNLTLDERQERDKEIQRMRTVFSRVCPEAANDWREQANLEFQSRYSPTGRKV